MDTIKANIAAAAKGFVIGVANIIPGVSGGTMALVLNIYERMINSIKNFSFHTFAAIIKALTFKRRHINTFKEEMKKADVLFFCLVFFGVTVAIAALSNFLTAMLERNYEITYGFFFGLIAVSVIVPFSVIKQKNIKMIIAAVIGVSLVIFLTTLAPDQVKIDNAVKAYEIKQASQTLDVDTYRLIMVFVTGIVATSAMILPGISGSFISILLGQYFYLLQALSSGNMPVILIYVIGMFTGLKLFSKLMSYLFDRFHDILMSFLTGLVIGSLYVTWPFKNTFVVGDEILYLSNIIPAEFGLNEWLAVFAVLIGAAIMAGTIILGKKASSSNPDNAESLSKQEG